MRFNQLGRREFITLLGGAATTWPMAARGQQGERARRIGVMIGGIETNTERQSQLKAFRDALQDLGWSESSNINFVYRWAGSNSDVIRATSSFA